MTESRRRIHHDAGDIYTWGYGGQSDRRELLACFSLVRRCVRTGRANADFKAIEIR